MCMCDRILFQLDNLHLATSFGEIHKFEKRAEWDGVPNTTLLVWHILFRFDNFWINGDVFLHRGICNGNELLH